MGDITKAFYFWSLQIKKAQEMEERAKQMAEDAERKAQEAADLEREVQCLCMCTILEMVRHNSSEILLFGE